MNKRRHFSSARSGDSGLSDETPAEKILIPARATIAATLFTLLAVGIFAATLFGGWMFTAMIFVHLSASLVESRLQAYFYTSFLAALLFGLLYYIAGRFRRIPLLVAGVSLLTMMVLTVMMGDVFLFLTLIVGGALVHALLFAGRALIRQSDRLVSAQAWRLRHLARGRCPVCQYNLQGMTGAYCPECGSCCEQRVKNKEEN